MIDLLENYFLAACPAVAIQTTDEARAVEVVTAAVARTGRGLAVWSATKGLTLFDLKAKTKRTMDQLAGVPLGVLASRSLPDNTVYVFLDMHLSIKDGDGLTLRALRDWVANGPEVGRTTVLVGNGYKPHPCMASLVTMLDHGLPEADDLRAIATKIATREKLPVPVADAVVMALSGLTATEAENACALSVVEADKLDPAVIYREKTGAVRRSGLLELIAPDPAGMANVGGLDLLKTWIGRRKKIWTAPARAYGLRSPKGILIAGIQGSGKSLAARAVGTELGIPTLRLDIGAIFNMWLGESERRMREVLALAEAVAPCVLWADEIEKGLSGMGGGGGNADAGAARRMFATLLTWMQEQRGVFIVATANRVESLPAELMRKGRFDAIWTVDLPSRADREAILKIQLRMRKRDPGKFDLRELVLLSVGYTGAEIEAAIDEAMIAAFDDGGREFNTDDVGLALADMEPLSKTHKEQVDAVRAWGRGRAKPAATPDADEADNN